MYLDANDDLGIIAACKNAAAQFKQIEGLQDQPDGKETTFGEWLREDIEWMVEGFLELLNIVAQLEENEREDGRPPKKIRAGHINSVQHECFYGEVRYSGGCNTNPTALAFGSIANRVTTNHLRVFNNAHHTLRAHEADHREDVIRRKYLKDKAAKVEMEKKIEQYDFFVRVLRRKQLNKWTRYVDGHVENRWEGWLCGNQLHPKMREYMTVIERKLHEKMLEIDRYQKQGQPFQQNKKQMRSVSFEKTKKILKAQELFDTDADLRQLEEEILRIEPVCYPLAPHDFTHMMYSVFLDVCHSQHAPTCASSQCCRSLLK